MSTPNSRNQECPCGSGKKFKHCHGRQKDLGSAMPLLAGAIVLLSVMLLVAFWPADAPIQEAASSQTRTTSYAEIPGIDLAQLNPGERYRYVNHLNHTDCACDCDMTIAECRNVDPGCDHSEKLANDLFAQSLERQLGVPASNH